MAENSKKDLSIDNFKAALCIVHEKLNHIGQIILPAVMALDKWFKEIKSAIPDNASENYKEKCDRLIKLGKYSPKLASNGWLISYFFGFSEIETLSVIACCDSLVELENKIKELYKEDIYVHAKSIIEKYPEKEFILGPAIEAHERGDYVLSILAFFVIAEGICRDNTGKEIFRGYSSERISSLAEEKIAEIESGNSMWLFGIFKIMNLVMWQQIIQQLPVAYNAKKRNEHDYTGLNRNTFLHGIATKEDVSEENSLKAFSLLSYVASFLSEERMDSIKFSGNK